MTTELNIQWGSAAPAPAAEVTVNHLRALVDQAIANARASFESERGIQIRTRLRIVRAFRAHLSSQAGDVARRLGEISARPAEEILSSEIIPLLDACRFLEKSAEKILGPRVHRSMPLWLFGARHEVVREPLGVVLVIGASNYPILLPGVQVLQALVAGNAVLLKPGPNGVEAAQVLMEMLEEAGLAAGLLQMLPSAREAGTLAITRGVDKVFLTGSVETGRKVLVHAATAITPAVVELSGCDGVFVLPDADVELAAKCVAFGLTLNSGQTCIAPRRVFVWREVAEAFTEKLRRELAKSAPICTKADPNSQFVTDVLEAISCGAAPVHGSVLKRGMIEGPVVIGNVTEELALARAENWGPNCCIIPVLNEEHALHVYRRSSFALGASIFANDVSAAKRFAGQLNAGSICINDLIVPTADGRLPFAGRKQSGFGSTRGPEGLLEMTAPKVISTRARRTHLHLQDRDEKQFGFLASYAALAYGAGGSRLRALFSLFTSRGKTSAQPSEKV